MLPPVILCIGTDRLIGDSLGPLTGSLLQRAHCPLPVYGTLAQPVHALNLADFLAEIRRTHLKQSGHRHRRLSWPRQPHRLSHAAPAWPSARRRCP
ncbi:MAG: DUF1256 domain-containing protein [Lachnospiraceae bacterium]